jgi:Ca-activated chloride channel homolog
LKYQGSGSEKISHDNSGEYMTIKIRYKKPDGNTSMLMEKPVRGYISDLDDASDNLKFAAAVSEFGMILRNSEFRGNSTLQSASELAKKGRGTDEDGYRSELVRLINTVRDMKLVSEQ